MPPTTFEEYIRSDCVVDEWFAIPFVVMDSILIVQHEWLAEVAVVARHRFERIAHPAGAIIASHVERTIQPLIEYLRTAGMRVERRGELIVQAIRRTI